MKKAQTTVEDILRTRCQSAPISYRDYIEIALYSEDYGYYTQLAQRVGRSPQHDFYTAESLGRVFATLVSTAAADLLPAGTAAESTFVEIAAEPGCSLLSQLAQHPFRAERVIRQGEAIQIEGQAVIFANEWLDALPFHRLIFRNGAWRERGVGLDSDGTLVEVLLDQLTPAVAAVAQRLPTHIEDGYELDLPLEAESALAALLAQDWKGLLLFFDYGRTWTALLQDHPSGTARTYKQHAQGNDLLETPGACNITCDINWTPLVAQMKAAGLQSVALESQESFLVKRAQRAAEAIVSGSAGSFSHDRQTLMELIHPANMGQRFQVLWGLRVD
ncbi:SAM-dependent methyltransferase [Coraliomargarita algicola]|uniref:SAM-dependent methyltransferase n=1 Tax=Coraliomargarita algicola TaxID=3092156 RepID=A0ABZ0RH64_9BACT|nr:SAM-dependent methyltransferase [Coraliomargarita sp. J2-16]WPJ94887.1 SAM-dependent methyltransferase [Coraliomargarita sp. J2-16]